MGETVHSVESKTLIAQVADEVAMFCRSLKDTEAIPGSTEVLESLIGKGKRLLHHNSDSVTQHILSLAATTTEITTSLVQQALSTCRMKHLRQMASRQPPRGTTSGSPRRSRSRKRGIKLAQSTNARNTERLAAHPIPPWPFAVGCFGMRTYNFPTGFFRININPEII